LRPVEEDTVTQSFPALTATVIKQIEPLAKDGTLTGTEGGAGAAENFHFGDTFFTEVFLRPLFPATLLLFGFP
jgi:hypothetical protein